MSSESTMVVRVATDERPFETPSSDESGMGRSDSPSDAEPEAALVVPPDGGWGWVVVFASFMCNFFVDGIIFSGGMLKDGIKKDFKISEGEVATVNSLLAGFYLLAGPFISALANKYGFRCVTIAGSIIASSAFAISYYADGVIFLYIIYGVIGGIGLCMIYMPAVLTVGFYFEKWRALATGLALCGSGVGTFVMAPLTDKLNESFGWRVTVLVHAGTLLSCIVFGAMFRPIEPVRVTLDDSSEDDEARRHEEAVEKLNSMLKLQSKFDSGISMPHERFTNKVTPHTWMGVANNTRYPTAEEVFRGSNSHLTQYSRRSSANAGAIKNTLGNKPLFIDVPVVEKDEQEDSNSNIDNTEPLITSKVKIVPVNYNSRRSHADLARPLYRDDIFFGASLTRLPQYTSRTSLGYHLAVTHVPTKEDAQEEQSNKCRFCPEAVRRALATMLDINLFLSPTFVILAVSGLFTMLGFFVPYMYIKQRALDNNVSKMSSDWLVSAIGVSNIVGRIICGMVSSMPKVSPLWLNNIALSAGGIATMLSGLHYSDAYQFGYTVVFGLAVACFASLRSILVVEYLGLEKLTNCFGLFLLFQGLGALLGNPIAGILYDQTQSYEIPFYVSGSFLLFSAVMCYPVDWVSKWEKSRKKYNDSTSIMG
ncbi:unnamed protein product [Diatraea saccharalis]|uniref:Uncharacterized protein n=2 Tax=Diatraea saccharalis TaxID=40085 RepID=A0A9N9R1W9_9NEOP|nr:unnamed protein product [Diatraea saccharalis]